MVWDLVLVSLLGGLLASGFFQSAEEAAERPASVDVLGNGLLYLLYFAFIGSIFWWLSIRHALSPGEFPPELSPAALARRAGLTVFLGAASFTLGVRRGAAAEGALAGLVGAVLGLAAYRHLFIAWALSMTGSPWGAWLAALLPVLLALSLALAGLALLHEDFRPSGGKWIAGLLLAWSLPAAAAHWRLTRAWGYGPRSLAEAAKVAPAEKAQVVTVAWLKPSGGRPYTLFHRRMAARAVDVSGESLRKLFFYLKAKDFRSLHARQALEALRAGWLLWWDADRSLQSAMLARPERAVPDYIGALDLIRAGPLTAERYQKLKGLSESAQAAKEGFETVGRAQRTFEAFASAFTRFGDEPNARVWLAKIDRLWPIYEKKVEVSPLQGLHEGRIEGVLLLNGTPASSVLVGLFFLTQSTFTARTEGYLSQSAFPDARGAFRFSDLGTGLYYLGLMAHPSNLDPVPGTRGIINSPGIIAVAEDKRAVKLEPILIQRR